MRRDEAVRLVSRALAVIQFVSAMEDITYLPSRMYSAHHYSGIGTTSYLQTTYNLDVGTLFLRIAGLLVLAWVFWNCGPRIARMLLPEEQDAGAEKRASERPL